MFKIALSPEFWATVKASVQAEAGGRIPVSFDVKYKRLSIPEAKILGERVAMAETGEDDDPVGFLMELCVDWRGVGDAEGNALPFSRESMQMMNDQGLGPAIIATFREALPQAKVKNS